MYWYGIMVGLVSCGVVFSFESDRILRRYLQIAYFPTILCILATFVGFRSSSPDYGSYSGWFDSVSAGGLTIVDWAKDPAFVLISSIVSMFGGTFATVALILAIGALVSQFYFCRTVSTQKWITLFFFLVVCRTFIGSDLASIRSGVAIPLMSLSIVLASRGRRTIALPLYIAALTFHLSILAGLLPFILSMLNVRFSSRWWILSVAIATGVMILFLQNLLQLLSFASRISTYTSALGDGSGPPSAYYVYISMRVLLLIIIVALCWNNIDTECRLALFCYAIGIGLQIAFIFNNALSWRSSDVFCLFDILVLTIPLKQLGGKWQSTYAVGLIALGSMFAYWSFGIMDPYRWIFA